MGSGDPKHVSRSSSIPDSGLRPEEPPSADSTQEIAILRSLSASALRVDHLVAEAISGIGARSPLTRSACCLYSLGRTGRRRRPEQEHMSTMTGTEVTAIWIGVREVSGTGTWSASRSSVVRWEGTIPTGAIGMA